MDHASNRQQSRKKMYKKQVDFDVERKRRREALKEQQRETRESRVELMRKMALSGADCDQEMITVEVEGQKQKIKKYVQFANMLMVPDWMTSVPSDLSQQWLCQLRPEGSRGILTIQGGQALFRKKSGRISGQAMIVDPIKLPCFGLTMLDVVIPDTVCDRRQNCVYVLDVLYWDGTDVSAADAECRQFWLKSRFDEIDLGREDLYDGDCMLSEQGPTDLPDLVLVPSVDATSENISSFYDSGSWMFTPDSLIFTHKQSKYWGKLTPLQLCWRDQHLSRFYIDTPDIQGQSRPTNQSVTLRIVKGSKPSFFFLETWDKRRVADVPASVLPKGCGLHQLVRVSIEGVDEAKGEVVGISQFFSVKPYRLYPDSWNRIVVQAWRRSADDRTPDIDAILSVADNPEEDTMDIEMDERDDEHDAQLEIEEET